MNIEIRQAKIEDTALLADLGASTFYATFSSFHSEEDMTAYLIKAYDVKTIATNLSDTAVAYFIAFQGNEALGYTKILLAANHPKLDGPSAELEKIYVLPEKIGRGIGKVLMQHAISFSKAKKYHHLYLGVWQENHRAVNFYKKAGFTVFDTRTFQLGQTLCDDFLMKLEL